jgi:hypothetical protein
VEQGIFSANTIKNGGTKVVGVGIGIGNAGGNLRAVSGPIENQDYFLSSNTGFADILRELATGACNNQLTITKQIQDSSGALITPTPVDANGWTFANTISAGSTIAATATTGVVNGANGVAAAAVTVPAGANPTLTVTEALKAGYSFVSAQCSVGGAAVATTVTGTTASFTGAAAKPMACTFTNKRLPVAISTAPSPATGAVGTPIHDTATVSGGLNPTGSVTFNLYAPDDTTCDPEVREPIFTSTKPLVGGNATSDPFTPTVVGTYHWVATYGGDANNKTVSSGCSAEPVTLAAASPTIATDPSAGGVVGTAIFDTATISGAVNPTGTVTFTLFAPGDTTCATPVFTSTVSLPARQIEVRSASFTTTATGTYNWVAKYGGDANNKTVSSGCGAEPVDIGIAQSAVISTSPSPGVVVGTGSIFDTATVSGGFNPTGRVTFELFSPADTGCTPSATEPVFTSTVGLGGTPPTATSDTFTPRAVGIYQWVAIYGGDANNATVSSRCGQEPVDISQATPAISTSPSPLSGPVGTAISDTATVTGGFNPTGTVTFELFSPADTTCTPSATEPVFTSSVGLSGGSATSAPPFTTTSVGTYNWVATYKGDTNNTTAGFACGAEPVHISQATPTFSTAPSAGVAGSPMTDTATVSGGFNPTGTVSFNLYAPGDTSCTTPVLTSTNPLIGGSATSDPFTPSAVGTYNWVASYSGDANNTAASSTCGDEPVVVTQATPTIATAPSPASGAVGTPIHDTATVSGGVNPTGTVTFNLYAPDDTACDPEVREPIFTSTKPLVGGNATSDPFTPTAVGTYNWVATYAGDANNKTVSSGCGDEPVTLGAASPTIATHPSAGGVVGTAIFDTATISGAVNPAGTVTFTLYAPGDTTCATPVFTSTVSLPARQVVVQSDPFTTTAAGTYNWVAKYSGDANNGAVSSGCGDEPVDIGVAQPGALTTAPSPGVVVGTGSIFDTATVSGGFNPTGSVTFNLYAPGDTTCATPVFTSTNGLSGTPPTATSDTFAPSAVGIYQWVAIYGGDANNATVTSACGEEPVDISQASPTFSTLPSPQTGPVGTAVSDTATVTGGVNPTGTVVFELFSPADTTCTPSTTEPVFTSTNPLSAGSATSDPFTTTTAGTYNWAATYSGDANNTTAGSSCGDEPVVVTQVTPTITTSPSPLTGPVGTAISDTATVSGGFNPTGTVTFELFSPADTTCTLSTTEPVFTSTNPLIGGSATSDSVTTVPPVGTYHWVATYDGDSNNATVSSACSDEPVDITQATPMVVTTPSPRSGPVATAIRDTATVSDAFMPTGTITFELFGPDDDTCAGNPVFTSADHALGGTPPRASSDSFTPTAVGTYNWVATYSGDTNNATAGSACGDEPVVVTQVTPAIMTTPSAGGPLGTLISDTATVSGGFNPTGTVTFALFAPGDTTCTGTPAFIATTPLTGGSATSGTFKTTALGTYRWIAIYGGDASNTTVSSGCDAEPVTITQAPQPTVAKTVTSNTQNPDGTWTIVYDIAVTNPNATIETSFTLTDTLAFGHNIKVNQAQAKEKAPAPAASPSWNGTTDTTIVANAPLAPGATLHYAVRVNATVLADATDSDRTCAAGGGFHNTAQVALPPTPATGTSSTRQLASANTDAAASACADPGSPTVTKKVVSVVAGSTQGQWTVTYAVTVANSSPTEVLYSLHDQLGFAAGVTVTSTSASRVHSALDGSGATAPQPIPGWTGTGSGAELASNRPLPAQTKDTYTIVVGATVTSSVAADAMACSSAGSGHGYYNSAALTSGSDQSSAEACDGITALVVEPPPASPAPVSPSPASPAPSATLPMTGVMLNRDVEAAAGLLGLGAALIVLSTRRRARRRHHIRRS